MSQLNPDSIIHTDDGNSPKAKNAISDKVLIGDQLIEDPPGFGNDDQGEYL